MLNSWFIIAASLLALPIFGDKNGENTPEFPTAVSQSQLEVYTGPKGKELKAPNYPLREQQPVSVKMG